MKIVNEEEISSTVNRLNYRDLTGGGGVKQMVIVFSQLAAGEEAKARVTFEVTRRSHLCAERDAPSFDLKKLDRLLQARPVDIDSRYLRSLPRPASGADLDEEGLVLGRRSK